MKRYHQRAAFTLIELLVVITIIGILAGIALPVYSSIQERGNQTKALSNAKQIGLALKLYASDNDGNFPQGPKGSDPSVSDPSVLPANANVALRFLLPDYITTESIFYVPKSAWTLSEPDDDINGANKLNTGENHWAYVPKLNDTSNPRFPLLADGFSTTVGVYSSDPAQKGGIWKGKKAIVIRVDQSGALETVKQSDLKVYGKTGGTTEKDIFKTDSWNPALPNAPINPA